MGDVFHNGYEKTIGKATDKELVNVRRCLTISMQEALQDAEKFRLQLDILTEELVARAYGELHPPEQLDNIVSRLSIRERRHMLNHDPTPRDERALDNAITEIEGSHDRVEKRAKNVAKKRERDVAADAKKRMRGVAAEAKKQSHEAKVEGRAARKVDREATAAAVAKRKEQRAELEKIVIELYNQGVKYGPMLDHLKLTELVPLRGTEWKKPALSSMVMRLRKEGRITAKRDGPWNRWGKDGQE